MHIGKEEYPPIPNIIVGRLNIRNNMDLIIERKIMKKENKNLIKFFRTNGVDGILIKFRFL